MPGGLVQEAQGRPDPQEGIGLSHFLLYNGSKSVPQYGWFPVPDGLSGSRRCSHPAALPVQARGMKQSAQAAAAGFLLYACLKRVWQG